MRLERVLRCADLCKHANIHLTMLKCINYEHILGVAKWGGAIAIRQYMYISYIQCHVNIKHNIMLGEKKKKTEERD